MPARLTKAQVEALLAHLDGPHDELLGALADAVEHLTGSRDVVGELRARGRDDVADGLAAGDEAFAWALATELNERRGLLLADGGGAWDTAGVELAHDLGGRQGIGAVEVEPDEPVFHAAWERNARALVYAAMGAHPDPTTSAFRHAIERMEPSGYLATSYYEHWLTAAATIAVESGVVTRDELEARAGGPFPLARPGATPRVEGTGAQRFQVGDRVVVVAAHHGGHSRCPGYVRGRTGTVIRVDDPASLPDVEAHSTRRVVEGTYGVRFEARDLWADADPHAVVHVDLWDSYLEPA